MYSSVAAGSLLNQGLCEGTKYRFDVDEFFYTNLVLFSICSLILIDLALTGISYLSSR